MIPKRIEQRVGELVWQRVYPLALGYEDLHDDDQPRTDPLPALLAGQADLAGQDRRRGRGSDGADRYREVRCDTAPVDRLLVDLFVEAQEEAPQEIMLHLDVTDTPLHGEQQGRFFHGYHGHYCYLPLNRATLEKQCRPSGLTWAPVGKIGDKKR